MKKIFLALLLAGGVSLFAMEIPSKDELNHVGRLIYKNETGEKREFLVHWNKGEEFPSLGIGHFIWYPENFKEGRFDESFPGLVKFYKEKGVTVPKIMENNRYSPWTNIDEFMGAKKRGEMEELTAFLEGTKDIQIEYIFLRLQSALEKMMKASDKPEHVKEQFYRVANSKNGLYPLIDYVNFKGEGIKESERYGGEGWGLLQILELMEGKEVGKSALKEFSEKAVFVLDRRIDNSPEERGEKRWRENWRNRSRSYSN
ncbi:MAG: hypothetical protein ACRCTS_08995 [Fusobacteriaceae bacterium]